MSEIITLRKRLKSIKSIEQSTKALQIITAAKIKTFQNLLKSFTEYKAELEDIYALVNQYHVAPPSTEAVAGRATNQVVIIVIISNRGFCGSFNQNVIQSTNQLIKKLQAEGKSVKLFLVGKKAIAYYKAETYALLGLDVKLAEKPEPKDTLRLVSRFLQELQNGRLERLYLSYNEFKSIVVQIPTVFQLLPFEPPAAKSAASPPGKPGQNQLLILEPSPQIVAADSFLHYLSILFLSKVMGSIVGEMGARLIITKNAVDNSRDLIGQLTLRINKARQAGITTELSELQSNFEILKEE
jgi:F-type H+-transporting ATPase subunit gamma